MPKVVTTCPNQLTASSNSLIRLRPILVNSQNRPQTAQVGLSRCDVTESLGLTPEAVDRERYLRRALGRSLEVEWLGTSIWTRRSVVAERYSNGRVFLAGDSVYQLSPTGALGMNTGIEN
jgi:2-polyprenyl-6-methoxyphenol hydroxylase-like FAD-dependent oxidoreductase